MTMYVVMLSVIGHEWYCRRGSSMSICPTKSGPIGANTVEEEHLRMWHLLNVHECVLLEKDIRA